MKLFTKNSISTVLAIILVLLSIASVQAEDTKVVRSIVANTFIGDAGVMVESFEIFVDDSTKFSTITKDDFEITGNYDGFPLNKQGEIIQENYVNDEIEITVTNHVIKLAFKPFKYPGGFVADFAVTSENFPELSFTKEDVTEERTKTVDEFAKLQFTGSNGVTIPYRLFTSNTGKPEPLVIWMHGAGEVGTDNVKPIIANRGAVAFAESGLTTSVIAAQYPYRYSQELTDTEIKDMKDFFEAYEELILSLVAEGKVDQDRVYLTGASMGGGLSLRFLVEKPDLFAAAVVIATRGTVKDLSELQVVSDLPIWLFHAEEDPTNVSSISKEIYQKLQELGNENVKLTIYSTEFMDALKLYGGLLHWSWVPALNNSEMVEWLYLQKQTKDKLEEVIENKDEVTNEESSTDSKMEAEPVLNKDNNEKPTATDREEIPKTGDSTNVMLYVVISLLSLGLLVFVNRKQKLLK